MNNKVVASFIFAGILTGALVSFQLKSPVPISSDFPADQLEAQRELTKSFSDEQALLKSQIVSLRQQIEESQQKNQTIATTSNLALLEELKKKIGLTNVSGPGVVIYLDDSIKIDRENKDSQSESIIHASDLRDIVNLLHTTKVQAIAINKQRIINTTPISAVGNSILINNSRLLPPFQINVVGDADFIQQAFKTSAIVKTLTERSKKVGIIFEVKAVKEHTVPLYNGDLVLEYLKLQTPSA